MRRIAVLALFLLFVGLVGPLAGAPSGSACCCPGNTQKCSAKQDGCSWTNGCGSPDEVSPAPVTVLVLPAATVLPAPAFAGPLGPCVPIPAVLATPDVLDPPPRA